MHRKSIPGRVNVLEKSEEECIARRKARGAVPSYAFPLMSTSAEPYKTPSRGRPGSTVSQATYSQRVFEKSAT